MIFIHKGALICKIHFLIVFFTSICVGAWECRAVLLHQRSSLSHSMFLQQVFVIVADCVCLGGVFRSQPPILRCLNVLLMYTCEQIPCNPGPRLPGLHFDSL
ncbi:hypothetical protein AMECASPLE_005953 [Ameca splendens]|uniref:Secreted protein n=1 Tax=Ameca splendens TaxID=208324 RepID=A0ABV0XCE2_9TELE